MKPFRRLGEATAPDGTVLSLFEHDGAYLMRVNGVELMSTRRHQSEDALAEMACTPLRELPAVQVLIGGLGLGFTLKAALALLAPDARVMVAEIVGAVIDWNRHPEYTALAGDALRDSRVEMRHADVAKVLAEHPATFDAIMLDVDNGAAALTNAGNAKLYRAAGIQTAIAALRPGGRLAYWSADADHAFATLLRKAGLAVAMTAVPVYGTSRSMHTLLVCTVKPPPRRRAEPNAER
ncbi:MAG: hypothetical protein NTZ43_08040 [Gemmatimonadetes bacterium]|nr:hypothetical protein [Gemmatimonadota bacterium]